MINRFLTTLLCAVTLIFTSCSDDDSTSGPINIVIEGAEIAPNVGGANQPNQVYVDLSTSESTAVKRDSWDLGFYSGSDFRVVLNSSVYMATAKLSVTDITTVTSTTQEVIDLQTQVAVGTFNPANIAFVDAPNGDLNNTAIAEISNTDANNYVYLVNLGFEVGTETPATGSVAVNGDPRGWKKIRILRSGDNYTLQYADLDDTTFEEMTITKDSDYNFKFFSFNTEDVVTVEPEAKKWDINFTVFTNEIPGYGSYGYTDYILNNNKANASVYMIDTETEDFTYDDFSLSDVADGSFVLNDRRTIGSSWRNGGGPSTQPSLKTNVFYIINDTDGNLYKLKFLAMTNDSGVRGYPKFVYSLLQ